jgi:4-hydroxy-tetrahydrodipicolinate reductase
MGQAILQVAAQDQEISIAGGLISPAAASEAGNRSRQPEPPLGTDLSQFTIGGGAVLVEFTVPEPTIEHAAEAAALGIGIVIGTTGLNASDHQALERAAERVPVLVASNMSIGINILLEEVERLARKLSGYDIEIIEMHHRHKKDSPSGTALSLAKAAADGRDIDLDSQMRCGRQGIMGERSRDEIGIHAVRGGDVVGDHTIIFAGEGERIELSHRATSRIAFASGAIRAAKFIGGCKPGLYSMQDVLRIHK